MRFEDMGIAWVPVEELVPYDNNAKRPHRLRYLTTISNAYPKCL